MEPSSPTLIDGLANMSMEVTVREVRYTTTFPWLRLGQAWGCALVPQQLVLSCAAVLVLTVVNQLLFVEPAVPGFRAWASWKAAFSVVASPLADVLLPGLRCLVIAPPARNLPPDAMPSQAGESVEQARAQAATLSNPSKWRSGLAATAAFVVWSAVGLALSRSTAVQFGREESPSFKAALNYGYQQFRPAVSAPMIPLGFAALFGCLLVVLALPGWLPGLGRVWLLLTSPLLCLCGLIAAFVGLSAPLLWPFMVSACSVDDSDAFDAFSRAFSLVTSRIWSTAVLLALCLLKGWLSAGLLSLLALATVNVSLWSLAWLGNESLVGWGGQLVEWWSNIFMRSVMASLFWSMVTIVYLFLREAVDGLPVHHLVGYDLPRSRAPYPVVGLAAVSPPPGATDV